MRQRGFTLIEMMIVVGLIGLLTTLAVFTYQDFVIRARVTDGLGLASSAKLAIAESAWKIDALPATQAETGYFGPVADANVQSISISNDGAAEIIITYTPAAGGGTIILKPTYNEKKELIWTCTGGTLTNRYRPVNCRL